MSSVDIFVVIFAAVCGYWAVSAWMDRARHGSTPESSERQADDGASAAQARGKVPHWTAVLGVAESASLDDIRSAYRAQMSRYHPDKVASLGDEFRALAERKAKDINAAYAAALKAKGSADDMEANTQ